VVLEAAEPLANAGAVYTEAARFCSREILIPRNPRGRLKPSRKIPGGLRNSASLA
jgi:hypothetical protein